MDDYRAMYSTLFNKITDVISELRAVQIEVEELYILQASEKCLPFQTAKTKSLRNRARPLSDDSHK